MPDPTGDRADPGLHHTPAPLRPPGPYAPGGAVMPPSPGAHVSWARSDHGHTVVVEPAETPRIIHVVYWLTAVVLTLIAVILLSAVTITALYVFQNGVHR